MNRALLAVVTAEHHAMRDGKPLRRVIAVNAINNVFESDHHFAHRSGSHAIFRAHAKWVRLAAYERGGGLDFDDCKLVQAGIRDGSVIRSREGDVGSCHIRALSCICIPGLIASG